MRRLIALLLVLHGFGHAVAAMWAGPAQQAWLVNAFWWIAVIGFIAAGIGLIETTRLTRVWLALAWASSLASIGLLAMYWQPALMIGAAVDGAILLTVFPWVRLEYLGALAEDPALIDQRTHTVDRATGRRA
jgi:hypothetical protein